MCEESDVFFPLLFGTEYLRIALLTVQLVPR